MNPRLRRMIRARTVSRTGQPPAVPVPPAAELARVAAEQTHPRLQVWHSRTGSGDWCWEITAPDGDLLDGDTRSTWLAALATGLDALDTASMTGRRP